MVCRFSGEVSPHVLSACRHLGFGASDSPNAHGFDEFFGFLGWNLGYYSHVTREDGAEAASGATALRNNSRPQPTPGYTTDLFTAAAIRFIRKQAGAFFVEVAYNAALPPYTPPAESVTTGLALEDSRGGVGTRDDYRHVVERLDESVGRIMEVLDDDALTIFTYDHGGAEMATQGVPPLPQGFATLWEGGLRVPLVLHWPAALGLGGVVVGTRECNGRLGL